MLTKNIEMCLQKLSLLPDCDHGNSLMQSPVMLQSALSSHSYLIYLVDNLKDSSVYWKNNVGVGNGENSRVTKHEALTVFLASVFNSKTGCSLGTQLSDLEAL